jgi:putative membrane protein
MMGYGAGLGFGIGGWLGMLGMVLLFVGAIVLIVWLVGRVAPPAAGSSVPPRPAGQDALEVLRLRFARGEITREEYLAAKQTLETDR